MKMVLTMLTTVILSLLSLGSLSQAQQYGTCVEPTVEQRLLSDDVRYASPFYMIGLPRNSNTKEMDNVCYTYFENGSKFFHIMSITYKNGSNAYYKYTKGDISNRVGLAEANGLSDSSCQYHDYTLTPVCNMTVFILYRCFIQGYCDRDIDIGITPGVDVRVVLAATPHVSDACKRETQASLQDTSVFKGGDYVILPQNLKPKCVTKYNNMNSIGHDRAVGSLEVVDNYVADRFGGNLGLPSAPLPSNSDSSKPQPHSVPLSTNNGQNILTQQSYPTASANFQGSSDKSQSSFTRPGQTAVPLPAWMKNNGQWNSGSTPWDQTSHMTHFHIWQPSTGVKTTMAKNPNVYYHIHSWDSPPPGCCPCNQRSNTKQ